MGSRLGFLPLILLLGSICRADMVTWRTGNTWDNVEVQVVYQRESALSLKATGTPAKYDENKVWRNCREVDFGTGKKASVIWNRTGTVWLDVLVRKVIDTGGKTKVQLELLPESTPKYSIRAGRLTGAQAVLTSEAETELPNSLLAEKGRISEILSRVRAEREVNAHLAPGKEVVPAKEKRLGCIRQLRTDLPAVFPSVVAEDGVHVYSIPSGLETFLFESLDKTSIVEAHLPVEEERSGNYLGRTPLLVRPNPGQYRLALVCSRPAGKRDRSRRGLAGESGCFENTTGRFNSWADKRGNWFGQEFDIVVYPRSVQDCQHRPRNTLIALFQKDGANPASLVRDSTGDERFQVDADLVRDAVESNTRGEIREPIISALSEALERVGAVGYETKRWTCFLEAAPFPVGLIHNIRRSFRGGGDAQNENLCVILDDVGTSGFLEVVAGGKSAVVTADQGKVFLEVDLLCLRKAEKNITLDRFLLQAGVQSIPVFQASVFGQGYRSAAPVPPADPQVLPEIALVLDLQADRRSVAISARDSRVAGLICGSPGPMEEPFRLRLAFEIPSGFAGKAVLNMAGMKMQFKM